MQILMSNNPSRRQPLRKQLHSESGVTMLEMVVAMLILTVGLLALAGSIGYAVTVSNKGRNLTNTKLLVVSLMEQMETLRNTEQLTFAQIRNQGQTVDDTGSTHHFDGFPVEFQPLSINPGPDGIFGTDDDLHSPGPNNIYGDQDDTIDNTWQVPGYTRQITVTNLSANLKRIQVTVRYPDSAGKLHDMVGVSYLNNDTRSNFR